MTGPEHYAEAELLLERVLDSDGTPPYDMNDWGAVTIAAAQVHATLALAAATSEFTDAQQYRDYVKHVAP